MPATQCRYLTAQSPIAYEMVLLKFEKAFSAKNADQCIVYNNALPRLDAKTRC